MPIYLLRAQQWRFRDKGLCKGHATRNDIVDDIVDFSSSTMAFNVAKIASARASLTKSLTKSLRVAGPLLAETCGQLGELSTRITQMRVLEETGGVIHDRR